MNRHVHDGARLGIDGIELQALNRPGYTNESFSFVLDPEAPSAVFTGDVLLIRGSRPTDFQGGDPRPSWDSIVNRLSASSPLSTIDGFAAPANLACGKPDAPHAAT
ncbi:hypothetical protein P9281_02905 [Caballeronia sp. LP003]|uniref:hypothetical protein n=1 Tax=Caballeronia sp. LP003 TaxID=3038551 RepID=UPI002867A6B3|nr:hypothetical protein [Caballeronia sp. LP003]MDR5785500.1 hypothetical protein [Caballeronia sp. LP003]